MLNTIRRTERRFSPELRPIQKKLIERNAKHARKLWKNIEPTEGMLKEKEKYALKLKPR